MCGKEKKEKIGGALLVSLETAAKGIQQIH